jgi:hypothetical protein
MQGAGKVMVIYPCALFIYITSTGKSVLTLIKYREYYPADVNF